MSEDLHHIDDLFRSGMEGKEETPSSKTWEHIEQALGEKDGRKRFFYFWHSRKLAAILLIALGSAALFAGGYMLRGYQQKAESREQKAESRKQRAESRMQKAERREQIAESGEQKAVNDNGGGVSEKSIMAPASAEQDLANSDQRASSNRSVTDTASRKHTSSRLTYQDKQTAPAVATGKNNKRSVSTSGVGEGGREQRADSGEQEAGSGMQQINLSAATAGEGSRYEEKADSVEPLSQSATRNIEKIDRAAREMVAPAAKISSPSSRSAIPVARKRSTPDIPRFSLTPVLSFQWGTNKIMESGYINSAAVKQGITSTESQGVSIGKGLLADIRITPRMTLQSGLIYSSRTIEIDPKTIYAERNPDGKVRYRFECSAGTYFIRPKGGNYPRPGDTAITRYSTNELSYVNIPLALTYHFGGHKLHLFATAGAGLNLLTDQYLETGLKYGSYYEEDTKTMNLRSRYMNGMIGAGVRWNMVKRLSLTASPQYQFAITPMNENMPVKAMPLSFNMQVGLQIRL